MARTVVPTNQFKRDIKKRSKELITPQWIEVMHCLLNDLPMLTKYRNHALTGDKKHLMDCHVKPDLVLLYEFEGDTDLILHRLGSHSELEI
ncbi:type II toxin-antitoxin system YafQ family toxin [Psychrobacter sp. APC 3350]|uniref:type II toxin-antitoxin system YafQ family toxin n=1 Tax=Psychrobacter sp. APC 3350 TaxID=3035195 RepID=UPI0025B472AF|nr:type II toxin-antitoxin system YafQ family toxin [Psychrobacter sp. APC 3350]MDN3454593.1 type II toxin-antitoxin system YafQ family toxin [Psychrobacter sp. APC 3350]